MTAAPTPEVHCVVCGNDTLLPLSTGMVFCPACQAEYDPAAPPTLAAGPSGDTDDNGETTTDSERSPAPSPFVTVVRVTGTDAFDGHPIEYLETFVTDTEHTVDDAEAHALAIAVTTHGLAEANAVALSREIEQAEQSPPVDLADLVDTEVRLVDGRVGVIVGFPDDDTISVRLADDEVLTVDYDDVTGSVAPPTPAGPVTVDVPDDVGLEIAEVNLTVATLALRAGLRMLTGDGPPYELGMPAVGWLPPDVDALPVIEQGVAYAIAVLVAGLGIPRATVEHVVDEVLANSETDLTKGEHDDEQSTATE